MSLFQEKEKGGEVKSKAWWLMEGEGEASNAWRPMEGEEEVSNAWRPMEGERGASFSPFSTPPPNNLLRPSSFSFNLTVLLYHSSRPLFTHSFFLSLAYKLRCTFRCHKSPTHSLLIRFGWKSLYFLLEIMASRMATSYEPQATQVNEELAL